MEEMWTSMEDHEVEKPRGSSSQITEEFPSIVVEIRDLLINDENYCESKDNVSTSSLVQ